MFTPFRCWAFSSLKTVDSHRARLLQLILGLALVVLSWQLASWARNPGIALLPAENSPSIPAGTILPVSLDDRISLKDVQRGQAIEAKITQDVPLPSDTIPAKSTVRGSIVSIEKDSDNAGVKLTLKFTQLDSRKQTLTISTYLRAIASFRAVRSAQMSLTGPDAGTPSGWADTVQIGGDIRFGDGGAVRNRAKQKVGKGVRGGVLVHVRANPALGCDGPVNGDDSPQALWVFSADACGVYDLKGAKITRTGKADPVGEISLHFEKDDMKLESGTGLLLRIVSQP